MIHSLVLKVGLVSGRDGLIPEDHGFGLVPRKERGV